MKVLVTGGTGLVGNAIQSISHEYPDYVFYFTGRKDADLTNIEETRAMFERIKPNCVIHLAAYVGGLYKNMHHKVDMLENNVLININVLKCAHEYNIHTCISCLSTCIFPDKTSYPINETMLHNGPPHHSNDGYAYAKRLLETQSRAYCEQYNRRYICVIPTNIYGPYDNFHLENGHVIPALIHQCFLAKKNKQSFVVRGSGKPLRQFIYSVDLAKLMMWVLNDYKEKDNLILSVNEEHEISIKTVALTIAKAFDYSDNIVFDSSFSDGQHKKTADNSKLVKVMKNINFTSFDIGIQETITWFRENYNTCRK